MSAVHNSLAMGRALLNVRTRPDAEVTHRKKEAQDRLAPKQGILSFEDDLQEMKPRFPTGEELAETVAVMRVLEAAAEPVSVEEIARHFAQGKQIEKRVGQVIAALARLGHLSPAEDGKKVTLRGGGVGASGSARRLRLTAG